MSTLPWLSVRGLRVQRGRRLILSDLELTLDGQELILLTGPNGAGKTTLLRVLAGLMRPQAGLFSCAGSDGNWRQSQVCLRDNVCYLHQQPYLFDASVFDNIAYGLRRQGTGRREIAERVAEVLELISLDALATRHSAELSGGEKQRVAIARAWALKPRMMLLDEPVANLDKRSRRQCLDLINRLPGDGIGVVLTSHDPQTGVLEVGRHIHLYEGRLRDKQPEKRCQEPYFPKLTERVTSAQIGS